MENKIMLREFFKEDAPAIWDIIREAWHYDEFCSPKTARKMARVFLDSCLANQTYTQVALSGGRPVGIIMAKNCRAHKCSPGSRLALVKSALALYCSKEGRRVAKMFSGVDDIDRQLLQSCSKNYPGEIAFFAVSAAARKKGIGKLLFQSALDYMKSQHIEKFYLFTDTSCNYGFYEHQGMERRCAKSHSFIIKNYNVKMDFFVYDYTFA